MNNLEGKTHGGKHHNALITLSTNFHSDAIQEYARMESVIQVYVWLVYIYISWSSTIDVYIMTSSFIVYSFSVNIESVEALKNGHCILSLNGSLPFTVQSAIRWYTWKNIVGLKFECFWYDSGLGRSIRGNFAQQRMTNLQCDN